MLNPARFYRKFRVIVDWYNEDKMETYTTRKVIDFSNVISYEEYAGPWFNDSKERVYVQFNMNVPPIIVRLSYDEFDRLFDDYHAQSGTLDNRSTKKKLNYQGPMKLYFDNDRSHIITTGYPQGFTFNDKSPDQIYDSILFNQITPMN